MDECQICKEKIYNCKCNESMGKIDIPLSIEKEKYIIMLEPIRNSNCLQEFSLTVKLKETIGISKYTIFAAKDINNLVEMESEMCLRKCINLHP